MSNYGLNPVVMAAVGMKNYRRNFLKKKLPWCFTPRHGFPPLLLHILYLLLNANAIYNRYKLIAWIRCIGWKEISIKARSTRKPMNEWGAISFCLPHPPHPHTHTHTGEALRSLTFKLLLDDRIILFIRPSNLRLRPKNTKLPPAFQQQ